MHIWLSTNVTWRELQSKYNFYFMQSNNFHKYFQSVQRRSAMKFWRMYYAFPASMANRSAQGRFISYFIFIVNKKKTHVSYKLFWHRLIRHCWLVVKDRMYEWINKSRRNRSEDKWFIWLILLSIVVIYCILCFLRLHNTILLLN